MEWVRGQCIGSGSSSRIHLATLKQPSLKHHSVLAVKSCVESNTGLLENEKEVLKELGYSPHIIQCFGDSHTVEENNGRLYSLLLEFAQGGSLSHKLKKFGCFQELDVKDYTRSILKDCRFWAGEESRGETGIRGTPLYMAPESVNNNEYESGVDIWALGCAIVEMVTGKPAWNSKPGTNMLVLLIRIGEGDELPVMPEELSPEGKDFLSKCLVKDPTQRWTAEMLLEHPFVADQRKDTVPLREEESGELSTSPRCHFDFPDWVSIQSPSPRSEFLSDGKVESVFPSFNSSCWISAPDRIRQLASDQCCNWSDSGCWSTVR
ncbi:CCR4-NOT TRANSCRIPTIONAL COMPLEX SUBUNIT CAF120-RELATED [Salix koriyanagi]|uniref:CCR4-NOT TRANSCRIPTIONAL COMPLEX SUBUNIT CAF120-RELATED n=1 Tax=Salix koriyanagi TaxID=2511006 RepID=A0A9Q0UNE3_9ROSI|nr:CCR4-NOT TRANSCRIPTIONAL COMPLEX SUBUNIT CAF120-RELATED [Salix koriyanagi]